VRQGRTDAWIAHKLDIAVDELTRFKSEHQLDEDEGSSLRPADPLSVEAPEPRAEEPEDEDEEDDAEDPRPPRRDRESSRRRSGSRPPRRREPRPDRDRERDRDEEPRRSRPPRAEREDADLDLDDRESDGDAARRPRRRRGRRGGRRHRARRNAFEATFDHGEEGYGLWLDPAVVDNPVYSEHWAGHRAVTVTVEADAITIRRTAADQPAGRDEDEPGDEPGARDDDY